MTKLEHCSAQDKRRKNKADPQEKKASTQKTHTQTIISEDQQESQKRDVKQRKEHKAGLG